jgi:hypothetical protein
MVERDERVTGSATITVGTTDDAGDEGRIWRLVAAVGVVALVAGLLVGVVPGRYVPQVAAGLGTTLRTVVLVGGGLIGLFGLYSLSADGGADDTGAKAPATDLRVSEEDPVELATRTRTRPGGSGVGIGRELDAELERIGGLVDGTERSASYRAYKVEQNLRELAVRVITSETGWSAGEARQRLESGAWTDDPRAAAFLSEETVVLPVTLRLTDWANGETFRRQVVATVDELARYVEVEER